MTCSIPGCDTQAKARTWCVKHYQRWRKHGSPEWEPPTLIERLSARLVETEQGCWEFTGYHDPMGYGRTGRGLNHQLTYEFYIGEVPDGLELDHLCRNRGCCNPWHLEPVTHRVNCERGDFTRYRDDLCPRGHDLSLPGNTYAHTRGEGRKCRPCAIRRARETHARKKEKESA